MTQQQHITVEAAAALAASGGQVVEAGTVGTTAPVGGNILDAAGKIWPTDIFKSLVVEVVEDAGANQTRVIIGNSRDALVIQGVWEKAVGVGALFRIKAPMDLRAALQDVLGGGANINAANPLQVFDPKVDGRLLLYGDVLYVDANPATGIDTNDGTRDNPFLTIQAAVNAASEYTTIVCVDSRVGALAVGFDENTQDGGVVINTNYITVIGGNIFGGSVLGGKIPITNSSATADNVFSGSGIGVVVCGFDATLPNDNGDEEVITLTGDHALVLHVDMINPVGTNGYRGIHLSGDDAHIIKCHLRLFDNDAIRLNGGTMQHVEESIVAGALNGVHMLTGCLGCVVDRGIVLANTVGVLIDVGATNNQVCKTDFDGNTADYTNNGGATNALIGCYNESQITAGQTIEDDLGDLYDRIGAPVGASVSADIAAVETLVDDLEGRLTAARAGNLDNCTYLEQTVPIKMNCLQTLNNTAAAADFIASNATGASGLISTDDAKVQEVFLLIIGRVVNSYAGTNALDCATAAHNQWTIGLDGGGYADLVNEEADGQMLDNDWLCAVEGAIHPFTLMFDVTSEITNIDGKIGVRLMNGRSEQASLIVTCDIYLKIIWKL